jgi:hypothetical protein
MTAAEPMSDEAAIHPFKRLKRNGQRKFDLQVPLARRHDGVCYRISGTRRLPLVAGASGARGRTLFDDRRNLSAFAARGGGARA